MPGDRYRCSQLPFIQFPEPYNFLFFIFILEVAMKLSSSVTSGLTILAASFLVGAAMDTEATGLVQGRKLQPSCQQNLAGADIVILFDESGSMEEEQDTAAAHTVTMFNAFAARTGATPRFAVGGFGRKDGWFHDELHELTDNFVTNTGELWSALNRLVTDGSYEEGYKALVDTFDRNNGYLRWDFQPGSRICAIIFTDEDSDGSTSAGDVNRAKGANAIIPVVSEGGNRYSAVSSLPGGQVLSLVEFVRNPAPTIMTIVNACVTALSPNAVCKNYALPHDGTCKRSAGANAFNGGSFDPQGDNLALSIYPPGPFPVSGVSTNTQVILSVSDPLANCDTCQATMTVTNAPPTAACKDITVPVNDASCVYVPTDLSQQVDNGSSDSDGSAGPTFNASPQGPFSVGQHVITLEVTDNCGAKASCTSTVTVTNSPPETKCQDIERVVDSACKWSPSSSMESEIDNGSVDGEGFGFGLSVSASGPFDGSYGGTSFPVTLTGTDSCGATSECVATVTLKDETPPTAACELAANPSGAYTMTGDDNCGAVFYVVDTGSGTEWGPYAAGTVFEYTKDPGAQPAIEAGEAGADWIINGMGNPYIKAVDGSGNESDPGPADSSDAWCADVPEPKTPPPEPTTTTSTTTSTTTTTTTTTTASQPLPPPPPPGAGGDPHFKVNLIVHCPSPLSSFIGKEVLVVSCSLIKSFHFHSGWKPRSSDSRLAIDMERKLV